MIYNALKKTIRIKSTTQKELADKIGMTEAGLNRALKNDTLRFKDLRKIADVLGVKVYELDDNYSGPSITNNTSINGNSNFNNGNINGDCNSCDQLKTEIKNLQKQIESCKDLLMAKNEIIQLLKLKK